MKFEQRLAQLREAVEDPSDPAAAKLIDRALSGKHGLLVSIAAAALPADPKGRLPRAFFTLMQDPVKRDPQCKGKTAIAEALRRIETDDDSVFMRGVRLRQREPVWGGSVDTAAALRGICAMGLVEMHHPAALAEAAELLMDPELAARVAAARAIGNSGNVEVGEPLLRLRLRVGDEEPSMLSECLGGLLHLAPERSLPLAGEHLRSRDEALAEAAALALGESRLAGAVELLAERVEEVVIDARRRVLLLALAMIRSEAAWGRLLGWIASGPRGLAAGAVEALGTFSHDERLGAQVRRAVSQRPDDACDVLVGQLFGPG